MTKLREWKMAGAVLAFFAATAIAAPAQVVLNTLFSFNGADGSAPHYMSLIQGTDGSFYGTTMARGADGDGVVFKITPTGTQTVLHTFCSQPNCADGSNPYVGLVQATDGNFYGTTYGGGTAYDGTVFKITPAGVLTTLYNFCVQGYPCVDGALPTGALVQGTDGNLYGTTTKGGLRGYYGGTVFRITTDGSLTTVYSFCTHPNTCPDGAIPFAGLIQDPKGNFYGTTMAGGSDGAGAVFRITPEGRLTTLYSFCSQEQCADGNEPQGALVEGLDGNLYGTTTLGGTNEGGGTVYKITPAGTLTTLYRFCEHPIRDWCPDSGRPLTGLALASNGDLVGTTSLRPTIFGISSAGKFEQYTQADNSSAGLLQGTDGLFYGTAGGGTFDEGTVFSLSIGLAPFVKTTPEFGQVGASVIILGTNLTGTTIVTFNGTQATFTIVSSSEITTSVPTGATSGKVEVTTPSGTLTSNVPFHVIP
jgi:uncharacterized repeat protein (TIGR03803 family)